MFRCVIVEDNQDDLNNLANIIGENYSGELSITGLASNIEAAKEIIIRTKPDVIFLDIQLPPFTGFDLLKSLNEINFETIFITSFDKYALQAIKFCALDYLLKPVDKQELFDAIGKLKSTKKNSRLRVNSLINNFSSSDENKKIVIPFIDGFTFIEIKDVLFCESDRNYTKIHTMEERVILSTRSLKYFDQLLSPFGFFRVHQSYLVNLSKIKSYIKRKDHLIKLKNEMVIPVSKAKRSDFAILLEQKKI